MSATTLSRYATEAETSKNDCASLHQGVPRHLIWTPTHGATIGLGARWLPSVTESFGNASRRNRKHTQPTFIPNEEPWRMFYPRFTSNHDLLFRRFNITDRELESRVSTVTRPGDIPLYCLEPELAASWQRLESTLGIAASYLIQRCSPRLPTIQPPPFPKSLGYLAAHTQKEFVVRTAIKSRDAFTMLGAYLTFALSLWMEDVETGNPWRIPFEILRSRPEYSPSQAWLDLLAVTQVCDINPGLRVGGFLDGRTSVWAFKIPAFLRAQVPVWVHWGLQPPTNAFTVNEVMLAHYLPKSKHIGPAKERGAHGEALVVPYAESSGAPNFPSAHTALPPANLPWLSNGPDDYIVPSTPPPVHLASDALVNEKEIAAPTPHPHSGQFKGETIEEFLRRKKDEEPGLEKLETPEGKQRRLARLELANNGQFFQRASYFQWDSAPGGHLLRTRIEKSRAEDVFLEMEEDQRVYHSFLNEWDLCEFLGERREPYADFMDDSDDDGPQGADLFPNELSLPAEPSSAFRDSAQDAIPVVQTEVAKALTPPGLLELLASRFGFQGGAGYVPSSNLYTPDRRPKPPKAIEAATALGDKKFFNSEQGQVEWVETAILDFAKISIATVGPRRNPIDTAELPPSFDMSPRAHYGRKAPLKIPLFLMDRVEGYSLIRQPACRWVEETLVVAIKSPATMLQLRRAEITTPDEAVQFLLSRGIAFNTARPWVRHAKPFPTEVSTNGLGWRLQGYAPDATEYALYVEMRRRLLHGPAGRAALMKGGILWRLAKDTESAVEEVFRGPSDESRWFGQKLGYDPTEDCSIVDDDLHESECDVICGVYRVEMGRNQAPKHSSWWPKPAVWAVSGFSIGQWTPDAEAWYQRRLSDIQSGNAQLFGSGEWTSKLRFQARYAVAIRENQEGMAANCLRNLHLL